MGILSGLVSLFRAAVLGRVPIPGLKMRPLPNSDLNWLWGERMGTQDVLRKDKIDNDRG